MTEPVILVTPAPEETLARMVEFDKEIQELDDTISQQSSALKQSKERREELVQLLRKTLRQASTPLPLFDLADEGNGAAPPTAG